MGGHESSPPYDRCFRLRDRARLDRRGDEVDLAVLPGGDHGGYRGTANMSAVRQFIGWNRRVSHWERALVSRLVPLSARDGATDFRDHSLPSLLTPGLRVLDVGGGRFPAVALETKRQLDLHVVGLDISGAELARAPRGAYDSVVVGDVASVSIPGKYDLVFSRTLLDHVADPPAAIAHLAA